jgi:kinetochore protein Spc25, fungi type
MPGLTLPRLGQLNLAAILTSQHPTIDLHLPAYEASTRNFSQAIADFNSRATAEINQRREAHTTELNRLAERAQNIEKETNQCKIKEIELIEGCATRSRVLSFDFAEPTLTIAVLEHEREETKEVESAVTALRPHVTAQREASASLDADNEQYRARVANLRNGQFLPFSTSIRPPSETSPPQSENWSVKRWICIVHAYLMSCALSSVLWAVSSRVSVRTSF